MFTGIVEERGRVRSVEDGRLVVESTAVSADTDLGASIAVNGVCLTVVERHGHDLAFDLAPETVARTTLGGLRSGDPVNLERPLTLTTRLGGHLVQGHVDGVGAIRSVERDGSGAAAWVEIPASVQPYVVEKGSIAVDGVSLTVAGLRNGAFCVALVPHTLAATTLGERRPGDRVNLEVDILAKYVERMARRSG